jgi:hypothetical protein
VVRWVGGVADRERPEELVFPGKINKSGDLIIWFDQLNFTSLHHHCILHAWTARLGPHLLIWDGSYRRFFINLLTSCRAVLRSFNRDDLFKFEEISFISTGFRCRRGVNEHRDEYAVLMRSDRSDNGARRWLDQEQKPPWRTKTSVLKETSVDHEMKDQ